MFRRTLVAALSLLVVCSIFGTTVYAASNIPPTPANGFYVRDDTKTLSSDETNKLNDKIGSYRKRTSVQLAVLMIAKLPSDEYLEGYSIKVAREWGVGDKTKNNGALLLVVKDERKLRIEVGTGLEGDLTDVRSSRIIRDRIAPQFKQEKYYQGIYDGLEGMTLAIGDVADPKLSEETSETPDIGGIVELVLFIGVFALSWLSAILGRSKSWWAGGMIGGVIGLLVVVFLLNLALVWSVIATIVLTLLGLLFDYFVSKNYKAAKNGGDSASWWAGGGSFGGSSGGGGFGGGSFGGGGSSGSW